MCALVNYRYQGACDVLYVILDGVMKCAIEHGDNQRRFGDAGMCQLILEAMERCVAIATCL